MYSNFSSKLVLNDAFNDLKNSGQYTIDTFSPF